MRVNSHRLLAFAVFLTLAAAAPAFAEGRDGADEPVFSTEGRQLRADVGIGATYALVGMNVEYAPLRFGSVFLGLTGIENFFGVTGGLRAYPFGNDNAANLFGHGFAGYVGLFVDSEKPAGDYYGAGYYGAGGGVEFALGDRYYLRLGADWVHVLEEDYALPLLGVSGKL